MRGITASSPMFAGAIIAVVTLAAFHVPSTAPLPSMRVVRSPSCACCGKWVSYMQKEGFTVTVDNKEQFTELKRSNGVTRDLESCHTAFVGGYVIEGHVPADLVKKLLTERPKGIRGLAAPGMPASAPGMDMPGEHYTVYAFDSTGHSRVYARY